MSGGCSLSGGLTLPAGCQAREERRLEGDRGFTGMVPVGLIVRQRAAPYGRWTGEVTIRHGDGRWGELRRVFVLVLRGAPEAYTSRRARGLCTRAG